MNKIENGFKNTSNNTINIDEEIDAATLEALRE